MNISHHDCTGLRATVISNDFFQRARKLNITLCHFKSNSHLLEGLAGETDLDILVADEDREKIKLLIKEMGFIEIISPPAKRYPGVFDFLGCDYNSGKLLHLHVHFKLIIGQKYIKNYQLPIEPFYLSDLRLCYGVPIPRAEKELFLLCLRANLKFSMMDFLRVGLGRRPLLFPNSILEEFKFLLTRVSDEKFNRVVCEGNLLLSKNVLLAFVDACRTEQLSLALLRRTRTEVFRSMKNYRLYHPVVCRGRVVWAALRTSRLILPFFPNKRKTLEKKGQILAVVGADGSGKTTLSKELTEWLSWKVDTTRLYLGKQRTFEIKIVIKLESALKVLPGVGSRKENLRLQKFLQRVQWILVARRRWKIYSRAQKLASVGKVVIVDRYPLPDFWTMMSPMDGPRIRSENGGNQCSLSKIEESYYHRISLPDKVFVLKVTIDELLRRKKATSVEHLAAKANAVNAILSRERIEIIDGGQDYDEVLINIKRKIWEGISC